MKLLNKMGVAGVLAGLTMLSGCSSEPLPPTAYYNWGDYSKQVYAHFQGTSGADQQAAILEKDIRPEYPQMAPGFYAHLGMLHAMLGKTDKALAEFDQEQTFYPESAHYMTLLKRSLTGTPQPAQPQADRS